MTSNGELGLDLKTNISSMNLTRMGIIGQVKSLRVLFKNLYESEIPRL